MIVAGKPINYETFIEKNFQIINKEGKIQRFITNRIQDRYYLDLRSHYGTNINGVRDIVLKARKEGISSLILAMFATDFLVAEYPIASVCISDKKEETKKLFTRAKFFIESALARHGKTLTEYCDVSNANEIRNKTNGAVFWIGTAGSKMASRAESVQNLHFSEAAHFPDTDIVTARETIEGALQMVEQGTGKVFIESTARGYGNYYQELWAKASTGESQFRPVFFSAKDFYSQEWLESKRKEFTTEAMFKQEYPNTPDESFMSTGSLFFDREAIRWLQKEVVREPIAQGYLNDYGELIEA